MIVFIVICAAMVIAALVWLTLPLWRRSAAADADVSKKERRISLAVLILFLPALAAGMYARLNNWSWDKVDTATAETARIDSMLQHLETRLAQNPDDVRGWMMLGQSNFALERYARAVDAYQRAYDLTRGEDVNVILGLGESLAALDQASLTGRAGELFNTALQKEPNNPKALWYGSIAALQAGDLRLGRDRLQALLAQHPPPQLQDMLERQIQDLNEQLGDAGNASAAGAAPVQNHTIRVVVSIAPDIQKRLNGPTPLFILARDPGGGGPPLAVQRHSSTEAPLTIELSQADAMMPSRTIATVPRVKVVARLSLSGAPQEHSGDFYGEADYEFSKDAGTVQILIDRTVP